ncbi:MAG: GTP 3',8-cyclase MoaA [Candidatus Brocadiia bacterium]
MSKSVPSISTLRVSITRACNMHCLYCREKGNNGAETSNRLGAGGIRAFAEFLQKEFGLKCIRLTGGEPLVRNDIVEWVEALALPGIDLALSTNGQRLGNLANELRQEGLKRVNISLDALDPDLFQQMSGGNLRATFDGIEAARKAGLIPLKTNTVVLRGLNEDQILPIAEYAFERDIEPRFLELMDIGHARLHHVEWFVTAKEILKTLRSRYSLSEIGREAGRTARRYTTPENNTLGIIAPETRPFCADCTRLRLSAHGFLFGCFMQDTGTDITKCFRSTGILDPDQARQCVRRAFRCKRGIEVQRRHRAVAEIGG